MARKLAALETGLRTLVAEHVDELVALISDVVRRNVSDQVQTLLQHSAGTTRGKALARRPRKGRDMACLSPGCRNTSKGPRFRYLCEAHLDSSTKEVDAWRLARREKAVSAGKRAGGKTKKGHTNGVGRRGAGRSGIRPCIAPHCTNPSKGPRFRFVCESHRGASLRDIQSWRRAKSMQAAA
jgi:hypothetical protein